jgi:hypothetical protein
MQRGRVINWRFRTRRKLSCEAINGKIRPSNYLYYEFVLKHEPAAVAINRTAAAQPRLSFFER